MGEIVHFVGKEGLAASANLEQFIAHAKANTPFNNINWDDNSWNITSFNIGKGQGKKKKIAHFKALRCPSGSKSTVVIPFSLPFLEFSKAAFSEIMRRFQLQEFKRFLYAMQAIEQGLLDAGKQACITELDANILDSAAELLKNRFADAWSVGRSLERLVTQVIAPAKLTKFPITWVSPIPYKQPIRSDRVAPKNNDKVVSRLPSVQTILDLAEIHHTSDHIPDRVVTSFVTLAMFAPSRGSEILSLPLNCIRHVEGDDGLMMGIAWDPAKGGQPLTKFAASETFETLAKDTVNFLADLGAPARKAALWYAENPGQLYMPEGTEHLRGKDLTLFEIAKILGRLTPIPVAHAARFKLVATEEKTNDMSRSGCSQRQWVRLYDFRALENLVIAKLPEIFPILDGSTGLKWYEALFVLPEHVLSPWHETNHNVPTVLSTNQMNHQLGNNPSGNTIFTRHGKAQRDGSPTAITTHGFRHLLNTLAQSKHLSESLIAFWSGRKSVKQNEWYDHVPQEAFIEAYLKLGDNVGGIASGEALSEKIQGLIASHGLTEQEAMGVELGAISVTRFGLCKHDYALTPCPLDKDCSNCSEHVFVKGDKRHQKEAEFQHGIHAKAVAAATVALAKGEAGAARWLKQNQPRMERWALVLEKMNDPSIPEGTMITLPPPENTQSKTGLAHAVRMITTDAEPAQQEDFADEAEEALMAMEFF
ncbi:TPA: hypothetical protein ACGJ68_000219 [Pseudomonas aeruginosa]|uniref:Uncharacterized protein n=1 Tax=Pseudomonas putida TaxID=303 RepID=A0A379L4A0_PSEPU|nr:MULTISPECIES: hypothetical protein [Pseudomonas]EKM7586370.1 hypothetical protein [Pseudomonas aeruginosa]EKX8550279.1 hypothetical protein [Pseudomonas aeruginosa]ELF2664442.1 hypothetical protein [Pseudomonas aeruginosa]MBA6117444.1 hypothetical protein [Pseudomonas putida]MCG3032756.1 hypothetical protein [Pseudomonas aeruginosa]